MEIDEENGLEHESMEQEQEEIHDEEAEGEAEEIDEAEAEEGELEDGEAEEDETVLEEEDDEAEEEGNLNGETSQGATSLGSHDSNDCSLMESSAAVSAQGNEDDDQSNPEDESSQSNRRKYKRKVWDPNAVREKLPRRAKDVAKETDSDFVEAPIAPVQITTPRPGRPRGRGRGRKKQTVFELGLVESAVLPNSDGSPVPVQTPTRGRGRGRGRGSRGPRGGGSRGGGTAGRVAKVRTPRGGGRPRPPKFQVMDEDARMSIENSFSGTLTGTPGGYGELSLNSSSSTKMKKLGTREIFDPSSQTPISAAQLIEYPWPHEDANAELWMVQEQVVNFLGLKGNFKRKYQDLKRRPVEAAERAWLLERKAVSETQANLGLTALQSRDVLDLFFNDFPDKYELYLAAQSEKKEQAYKSKGPKTAATPGGQTPAEKKPFDPRLRAIKAAAKWNTMFNKERVEERLTCIDLQTYTVHFPRRPTKLLQQTRVDPYPVAVIPGQFSSYYKPYSPYQLSCMPINTITRNPLDGPPPDSVSRRKRRPTNASSSKGESTADSQTESDDSSSSSDDDSR